MATAWTSSLAEGLELLITVAASNDESVVAGLLDDAGGDELGHQVSCRLARLHLVLELLQAVLHLVELGDLQGLFGLQSLFLLLLGFDLGLCSFSLRSHLQELGTNALADYKLKI